MTPNYVDIVHLGVISANRGCPGLGLRMLWSWMLTVGIALLFGMDVSGAQTLAIPTHHADVGRIG